MKTVFAETDYFVVAYKQHGTPTVPLHCQKMEGTLLYLVSLECPEVLSVNGRNKWEYGALHRLDTPTAGLVVFAKTQSFYDTMCINQENNRFEKIYNADVCGKSSVCPDKIESYFRYFGPGRKKVMPVFDLRRAETDRLYTTKFRTLSENKIECTITKGFRHQIRSHLAYLNIPIVGDVLYGGFEDSFLHLECTSVKFQYRDDYFCFTVDTPL